MDTFKTKRPPKNSEEAKLSERLAREYREKQLNPLFGRVRRWARAEYGEGKIPIECYLRASMRFNLPYASVKAILQGRTRFHIEREGA